MESISQKNELIVMDKNREELGKVLLSYTSFLKRRLYKMNSNLSDFEMEDIISNTFEKVLKQPHIDITHPSFRGYVANALRNVYIDHWRKYQRQKTILIHTSEDYVEKDSGLNFDNNKLDYELLWNKIGRILKRQDIIIWNYWMLGYKMREIAEVMNIAEGTVKYHIHNIKKLLQSKLFGKNEEVL